MNRGPLIFLVAFTAAAGSWFGCVFSSTFQLGSLQQTNTLGVPITYPVARSGQAQQGLQVYRANGCVACHSQQLQQSGTVFEAVINDVGTNHAGVLAALLSVKPGLHETQAAELLSALPKTILRSPQRMPAEIAVKALSTNGASAAMWIVPVGPDIDRGWGKRRSVAEDFLFDYPVMPGSQRTGPDLASVGSRLPDAQWHLRHLYAPRSEVKDSTMTAYRFLFELRKQGRSPSPEALALPKEFAPPPGYEVVPKPEANALAAYLLSLRTDAPLFLAPFTVASARVASPTTNSNSGSVSAPVSTNSPAK